MKPISRIGTGLFLSSFAIGVAALASACSSNNNSSGSAACQRFFSAQQAHDARCGDAMSSSEAQSRYVSRATQMCEKVLSLPGQGITTAWLEGCAAGLETARCSATPAACREPRGTLETGAACEDGTQCKSGDCDSPPVADGSAPNSRCGKCEPEEPGDEGQPCTSKDACKERFECVAGKCQAPVPGDVGASCSSARGCKDTLRCDTSSNKCAPLGKKGESCVGSRDCTDDLRCDVAKCTAKLPAGAKCMAPSDCERGLSCIPSTATCGKQVRAKAGEACGAGVLCDVGLCNDTSSGLGEMRGTCPTVIADGAACNRMDRGAVCDSFANCIDGKCQAVVGSCKAPGDGGL